MFGLGKIFDLIKLLIQTILDLIQAIKGNKKDV